MKPIDIYHQYPIELIAGKGIKLNDASGKDYIDFYGGHGVISIGHSHQAWVDSITKQLKTMAFYSNAFQNNLQNKVATLLGELSGYYEYQLFLSNSGAEANENAIKAASFYTGRKKVLAIKGAFHGRSAGALAVTDNQTIKPAYGSDIQVTFIGLNDLESLTTILDTKEYAAFIIEGIQGVNGVWEADTYFWDSARRICTQTGTILIADEVQSGYGRTGKFFAHQHHDVFADIVTTGKGMGNGFPVAGTLIHQSIRLDKGLLGTTFGGGQLACAAAISVLESIRDENLMKNAGSVGNYLKMELENTQGITKVRGRGLMLGIEFEGDHKKIRNSLMMDYGYITGFSGPNIVRLLPPLTVSKSDAEGFINALNTVLKNNT